ncbi:MAG: hypothetical protein ACE5I5_15965 [Candidatus Heimdallarchaeota archaeon]
MANYKQVALLLIPSYAIIILLWDFFQVKGFLIWTVIAVAILIGQSVYESGTSPPEKPFKKKKDRRDEIPMVEYSDLVVTRIAPKKKRGWEKKISRYSKLDRKKR